MSATRILVAEDEVVYRHMLRTFLAKWGYQVTMVSDGLDAWNELQREDRPRLAILDWMMPNMDGVEICRGIRERKVEPYIYLLLLTSRDQKGDVVQGIEAGADDYLIKPFDPRELRARIRAGERIIELEDRLIRTQAALRELAVRDPLTGLMNRRACLDSLTAELHRGARAGCPVCIVMADIDHFKRINDTYGHLTGDDVLCEVAHRIHASLRDYDIAGRFGGEEFLLVLPDCTMEKGMKLAERICHVVGSQPVEVKNTAIKVSISLGVAIGNPEVSLDLEALLGAADAALYRAKALGRNRTESAPIPVPPTG